MKWDDSLHPRDESGRFTGNGGNLSSTESKDDTGKYNTSKIIGTITSTGVEVKSVSKHALQRMKQRHISANKIVKVLTSDDAVVTAGNNEKTTCYFKDKTRVVVDHIDGKIITCIRRDKA